MKVKDNAIHVQAWKGPGELKGSQILWQSAHEGGKVVSPTQRPPLPWYLFLLEGESILWPQGG